MITSKATTTYQGINSTVIVKNDGGLYLLPVKGITRAVTGTGHLDWRHSLVMTGYC